MSNEESKPPNNLMKNENNEDEEIAQTNDTITPNAKGLRMMRRSWNPDDDADAPNPTTTTTTYDKLNTTPNKNKNFISIMNYCNEETENVAMVNESLLPDDENDDEMKTIPLIKPPPPAPAADLLPKSKKINIIKNIQNENENQNENDIEIEFEKINMEFLPLKASGKAAVVVIDEAADHKEDPSSSQNENDKTIVSSANIEIENLYFSLTPSMENHHEAIDEADSKNFPKKYDESFKAELSALVVEPMVIMADDDDVDQTESKADAFASYISAEGKSLPKVNQGEHIFLTPPSKTSSSSSSSSSKFKHNTSNLFINRSLNGSTNTKSLCNKNIFNLNTNALSNFVAIKSSDNIDASSASAVLAESFYKKKTSYQNSNPNPNRNRNDDEHEPEAGAEADSEERGSLKSICIGSVGAGVSVSGGSINCKEDDYTDEALSNAVTNIKTSLSMTSLSPDEKRESRDVIKEKLKMERPYNSLKKSAFGHRANSMASQKRYSWESGNSHSSSSLHSSTTLGLGSCKDDLWSAIQTNYYYIMDTNLLDSCKEARHEIEGATNVLESPIKFCSKILDETNRSEDFCGDLNELRKWLIDMEHKLANAPTVTEAISFNIAELQQRLTEYSVLYHEIVSHARVVSACIRVATEKERKQQQLEQNQQQSLNNCKSSSFAEKNNSSLSSADETSSVIATSLSLDETSKSQSHSLTSTSGIGASLESKSPFTSPQSSSVSASASAETSTSTASSLKSSASASASASVSSKKNSSARREVNFEELQNRYHLLYLKALEVQLCLDGLLTKKSSELHDETDEDIEDVESDEVGGLDGDICSSGATEDDLDHVNSDLESEDHRSIQSEDKVDFPHHPPHHHHLPEKTFIAKAKFVCTDSKAYCEDGDDEGGEDEDDDDDEDLENANDDDDKKSLAKKNSKTNWFYLVNETLRKSTPTVTNSSSSSTATPKKLSTTLTDFEADSESSDFEFVLNFKRHRKFNYYNTHQPLHQQHLILQQIYQQHHQHHHQKKSLEFSLAPEEQEEEEEDSSKKAGEGGAQESLEENTNSSDNVTEVVQLNRMSHFTTNTGTTNSCTSSSSSSQAEALKMSRSSVAISAAATSTTSFVETENASAAASTPMQNKINIMKIASSSDNIYQFKATTNVATTNGDGGGGSSITTSSSTSSSTTTTTKIIKTSSSTKVDEEMLQNLSSNMTFNGSKSCMQQQNLSAATTPVKHKSIAVILPNSHNQRNYHETNNFVINKSPPQNVVGSRRQTKLKQPKQQSKHQSQQHSRHIDISKFNLSNRKSKNCATFYFKHLDTDNEANYGGEADGNCDRNIDKNRKNDHHHNNRHDHQHETNDDVYHQEIQDDDDDDEEDEDEHEHELQIAHNNIDALQNGDIDGHSQSSNSPSSDVLKSAEASSDEGEEEDEGWLYSSLTPTQKPHQQFHQPQQHQQENPHIPPHHHHHQHLYPQQNSQVTSECCLSSKSKIISTVIVDGIQSSAVSSSTATATASGTSAQGKVKNFFQATTTTTKSSKKLKVNVALIEASDLQQETPPQQSDSDKESKEEGSPELAARTPQRLVSLNSYQTVAHFEGNPSDEQQLPRIANSSLSSSSSTALSNNAVMSSSTSSSITSGGTQLSNCSSELQSEATTQAHQQMVLVHCHSSEAPNKTMADLQINNIYSASKRNGSGSASASGSGSRSGSSKTSNATEASSCQNHNNNNNENKTNNIINSNCYTFVHNNNNNNNNNNHHNDQQQQQIFLKAKKKNIAAPGTGSSPSPSSQSNHQYHQALKASESTDSDDHNSKYPSNPTTFIATANGHKLKNTQICSYSRAAADLHNGNVNVNLNGNSKPLNDGGSSTSSKMMLHPQHAANLNKSLPPRSPGKSIKPPRRCSSSVSTTASVTKNKISQESIKQLVIEAEHLVRDEALKTPTKTKHTTIKISSTVKKREINMPGPIKQRVEEWLQHQPSSPTELNNKSYEFAVHSVNRFGVIATATDDCEASGEASETDSIPPTASETSEGFSDSIATCMQTSTNSYGNSTERIGGSAEPVGANNPLHGSSNQSLNLKVVKRQTGNRRKAERPWSVSCLSQLTTDSVQEGAKENSVSQVQSGLASHSISESALDSLSPKCNRPRVSSSSAMNSSSNVRKYDSKGSLKRRKTRKKKLSSGGKRTDSGSDKREELPKINHNLFKKSSCESMTAQQIQELTNGLLHGKMRSSHSFSSPSDYKRSSSFSLTQNPSSLQQRSLESEEEQQLIKPNFKVGSYTTAYMTSEARLGPLAALASYNYDEEQQAETGTEDHHSSFSETAWDNYQEKYNSENYSEGFDSDAARRLLEFGDDYRNFIDSQSDCCSLLSAANNMDSLSPPRMDSLQQNEAKIITQDNIVSSVDHARRRRALELEYERRRKTLEARRKSCQENLESVQTQQYHHYTQQQQQQQQQQQVQNHQNHQNQQHSPQQQRNSIFACLPSSSANAVTPKNTAEKASKQAHKLEYSGRKLDFGMSHSSQSLRRTSESDTSTRRRKTADERRRSSRNLEKCIKLMPATTSSSNSDDSDDEKEMRNLLQKSRDRLDDTKALKIRCHLLRPEDYTEIINTCRDNIRCLESVLRGPPGSVLSTQCVAQTKDLLAAWEDLLNWSENASAARKMQEEMIILKHALNRLGNKANYDLMDTEPAIQIAIEALKNEKSQLQSYRTSMLRLNASVHSWLTRQERKLQAALLEQAAEKLSQELSEEKSPEDLKEIVEDFNEQESKHLAEGEEDQDQAVEESPSDLSATKQEIQSTIITVTDSNGNQLESYTTNAIVKDSTSFGLPEISTAATNATTTTTVMTSTSTNTLEKNWDLESLRTSENEFHKHLKDEVSDMYTAWDEADERINTKLELLTNSLIAWRQLECGLSEFHQVLGKDRGTLKGLEGALDKGQQSPNDLVQNVKLVAKLLSENVHVSQEQLTAAHEHLDPNHILHITKFTASNGSLSDSGISDGGATSDGGLSERERRLGVLRRLAKQLESALAPGSEAMKSIAARMESAEAELKSLQNTCRDLIVRTATSHQNKKHQQQQQQQQLLQSQQNEKKPGNGFIQNGEIKALLQDEAKLLQDLETSPDGSPNKRRNKKKQNNQKRRNSKEKASSKAKALEDEENSLKAAVMKTSADGGGDDPYDDPALELETSDDDSNSEGAPKRKGWAWRIARVAVPMQLALFTVYCAACMMQPNCCDNLNNFSMSFAPQLRYIRGPPPI